MAWLALPALAGVLSLALAACRVGDSEKARSTSGPTATALTNTPPRAFVRRCETRVFGTLDDPAWRRHSIIAGPLVFYSADQYAEQPASLFTPLVGDDDHYAGQKLLVLVRPGAIATVVVPEASRNNAALLYDPAAWNDRNAYRIEEGERRDVQGLQEGRGRTGGRTGQCDDAVQRRLRRRGRSLRSS